MEEKNYHIKLSDEPLDCGSCRDFVRSPSCGALVVFEGWVRDQTQDRKVLRLEFEAYEEMARKEMEKIAVRALRDFNIERIAIHHRTGILEIGDVPVVIAVGSAHRDAGFTACRFAIDMLKETVPIWKKEIFTDGETWVSARP